MENNNIQLTPNQLPKIKTSYSSPPSKGKSKFFIIFLSFLTISLLTISSFLFYQNQQLKTLQLDRDLSNVSPTSTLTNSINKEKEKVILYQVTKGDIENLNIKIMRKIGNNNPEEILDVSKDPPTDYISILNNNYVVLNYSNRLSVLNLQTKEVKDILTYQHGYNYQGVVVSQDGSQLLAVDQAYAANDNSLSIYKISTKDWTSSLIYQELHSPSTQPNLYPIVWRDDDVVIMGQAMGEFSNMLFFDLKSNKLTKSSEGLWRRDFSTSGKLLGLCRLTVDNPCDAMSGSSIGNCEIIEPLSGQKFGQIGDDSKVVSIITFSPDDKEVLYSVSDPISFMPDPTNEDYFAPCSDSEKEQYKSRKYYKKNIVDKDSVSTEINDIQQVISNWDQNYGANIFYEMKDSFRDSNNQVFFAPNENLQIINIYFQ